MIVTGIIPQKPVELTIKTDQASEAVRQFKERHPAAIVDAIDGELVLGMCESCSEPVMDAEEVQAHYLSEEHLYVCFGCRPKGAKS